MTAGQLASGQAMLDDSWPMDRWVVGTPKAKIFTLTSTGQVSRGASVETLNPERPSDRLLSNGLV